MISFSIAHEVRPSIISLHLPCHSSSVTTTFSSSTWMRVLKRLKQFSSFQELHVTYTIGIGNFHFFWKTDSVSSLQILEARAALPLRRRLRTSMPTPGRMRTHQSSTTTHKPLHKISLHFFRISTLSQSS